MGLARAGLTLEMRRIFAAGGAVVAEQRGVWRSVETGEFVGEADVASCFRGAGGRVAYLSRRDDLRAALEEAGPSYADEVSLVRRARPVQQALPRGAAHTLLDVHGERTVGGERDLDLV